MQVLGLRMPGFLVLSFPDGNLDGHLCWPTAALSSNGELKALRSLGVSTWRMVVPALLVAVLMSLITFLFNDLIVPKCQPPGDRHAPSGRWASQWRRRREATSSIPASAAGKRPMRKGRANANLSQLFYSRQFRDGGMKDVTVLDFSRDSGTQILSADRAVWSEAEGMWEFLGRQDRAGGAG